MWSPIMAMQAIPFVARAPLPRTQYLSQATQAVPHMHVANMQSVAQRNFSANHIILLPVLLAIFYLKVQASS